MMPEIRPTRCAVAPSGGTAHRQRFCARTDHLVAVDLWLFLRFVSSESWRQTTAARSAGGPRRGSSIGARPEQSAGCERRVKYLRSIAYVSARQAGWCVRRSRAPTLGLRRAVFQARRQARAPPSRPDREIDNEAAPQRRGWEGTPAPRRDSASALRPCLAMTAFPTAPRAVTRLPWDRTHRLRLRSNAHRADGPCESRPGRHASHRARGC